MTPLETEMAHLLRLVGCPTFSPAWRDYAQWKAEKLATKYPQEYADLPRLLTVEMKRLESSLSPPKQPEQGTPS